MCCARVGDETAVKSAAAFDGGPTNGSMRRDIRSEREGTGPDDERHSLLSIAEMDQATVATVVEAFIRDGLDAGVSTFEIRLPEAATRGYQEAIATSVLRALLPGPHAGAVDPHK